LSRWQIILFLKYTILKLIGRPKWLEECFKARGVNVLPLAFKKIKRFNCKNYFQARKRYYLK